MSHGMFACCLDIPCRWVQSRRSICLLIKNFVWLDHGLFHGMFVYKSGLGRVKGTPNGAISLLEPQKTIPSGRAPPTFSITQVNRLVKFLSDVFFFKPAGISLSPDTGGGQGQDEGVSVCSRALCRLLCGGIHRAVGICRPGGCPFVGEPRARQGGKVFESSRCWREDGHLLSVWTAGQLWPGNRCFRKIIAPSSRQFEEAWRQADHAHDSIGHCH